MSEAIRCIQNVYRDREVNEFNKEALVGAGVLNMARLLAAVANTLGRGLGRAVTGQVANLSAVVALLSLCAITAHVAKAAA